jgi:hypothetical protein
VVERGIQVPREEPIRVCLGIDGHGAKVAVFASYGCVAGVRLVVPSCWAVAVVAVAVVDEVPECCATALVD